MKVQLAVIEGPHSGRSFQFDAHDTFIVGRGTHSHFRLPSKDPYFSRTHFMIEVNPPLCRLFDMASTNGTFVNGRQVTEIDLHHGDSISGGDTTIAVAIEGLPADAAVRGTLLETLPPRNLGLRQTLAVPMSSAGDGDPRRTQAEASRSDCGSDEARRTLVEGAPLSGSDRSSGQSPTSPPAQIGRYAVVREIGRGGMGTVYLATDTDGSQVAVKTIAPNVPACSNDVDLFLREATILQELKHPNIVQFLEQGEQAGLLWFAMEYVAGQNAAALLREAGPLPTPRAVSIVCQLLAALEHAHRLQFVHRDVKPENVLVTTIEGKARVKLADFGLSRVYQASTMSGLTLHGQMGGSLAYMAPEQVTSYRDVHPACDQYAAAATLYRLLTGKYIHEFPQAFHERILKILQGTPIPLRQRRPKTHPALAMAVDRALARDPDKRFASCEEFRQALLPFARTRPKPTR